MKKVLSYILAVAVIIVSVCAFAGCSRQATECDIALITNGEDIKNGTNTSLALDGIKEYCKDNKMKYSYFPTDMSANSTLDSISNSIKDAVEKKAEYIVLLGDEFAVSAYKVAPEYPDVNFILIDAIPHSSEDNVMHIIQNVMSVSFNSLDAGFLAGYCSVVDGNTKLGYVGSIKSNYSGDYGAGFANGIAYACDEQDVKATLEYADFDSPSLSFNYALRLIPKYKDIDIEKLEDLDGVSIDENEKTIVIVQDGEGTGLYKAGDKVEISADKKKDSKAFEKWLCYDAYGKEISVDFEDASSPKTTFEMVDRVPSLVEKMCDDGVEVVFAGGNLRSDQINESTVKYGKKFISNNISDAQNEACESAVILDYGRAIQIALKDYKGGSIAQAGCANNCIYINGKSAEKKNKGYDSKYGRAYDMLKNGEISMLHVQSGGDFRPTINSKNLTIKYLINE